MSIGRWMDKEVVVPIHKGILLNYKKEHSWVSSIEVDVPRTYYRVMSEREKQILYINAYIWNLERWYHWPYVTAGDTDVKNRLLDYVGDGTGGMNSENSTETYILPYVK